MRKKEDEFFSKGIKKGRAEGRAEGEKEGIKKGSYKEKLESAQKMKRNNLSIEDIMFYTGLSKEEIDAIPL